MSSEERHAESGRWTRRQFVQLTAAGVVGAGLGPPAPAAYPTDLQTMIGVPFEKRIPRIAIIGTGGRGTALLGNLLAASAKIIALCDIVESKAEHAASLVVASCQPKPALYTKGPQAFRSMLDRSDVDLVLVATPWTWHAEQAIAAMKADKDVLVEVPAVTSLEDCWKLVRTSEETRKHCMMLENCCYGYNETLILRMVHAGKFGDLLSGEGAYLHDLREELFSNAGEGLWRRAEHTKRDGNLYPTHGLGPVANYMGIQRGDRFRYLVSMSTPQRGLDQYRLDHLKPGDPRLAERYLTGDINTSLIKTQQGLTITVKHTVSTPRPYDRINQIAGTRGTFQDYPPRICLEENKKLEEESKLAGSDRTSGEGKLASAIRKESWGSLESYKQYEHPLWRQQGKFAQEVGGHGGMDYIMVYRLLQCVQQGLPPDMDVYDAAAWSSVGPLSVESVAEGSAPVQFPDFTRGGWPKRHASAIATQS